MNFLNILPDDFVKKRAYTAFLWGFLPEMERKKTKKSHKTMGHKYQICCRRLIGCFPIGISFGAWAHKLCIWLVHSLVLKISPQCILSGIRKKKA